VVSRIEPLLGTPEADWERWSASARAGWPELDLDALLGQPIVVLAAHPDDEVLGAGGLVSLLASAGAHLRFVWATDGEASHPGSSAAGVRGLAGTRRAESAAALDRLGAAAASRVRLELPDGGLAQREDDLVRRLRCVTGPDDLVITPWRGDAHPDHDACGRAAAAVTSRLMEYPVWAWHWARPDDDRVPWDRAVRVDLPAGVRARKAAAVSCFASQVRSLGPEPTDGPVLPPGVLAHFARDYEVFFR